MPHFIYFFARHMCCVAVGIFIYFFESARYTNIPNIKNLFLIFKFEGHKKWSNIFWLRWKKHLFKFEVKHVKMTYFKINIRKWNLKLNMFFEKRIFQFYFYLFFRSHLTNNLIAMQKLLYNVLNTKDSNYIEFLLSIDLTDLRQKTYIG